MEPQLPPLAVEALARAVNGSSWRQDVDEPAAPPSPDPARTGAEALDALDALARRTIWLLGADPIVR